MTSSSSLADGSGPTAAAAQVTDLSAGIPGGLGRYAGHAWYRLADALALLLPIALGIAGARLGLAADVSALLAAAAVIALAGGLVPALAWTVAAALLLLCARVARHSALPAGGIGAAAIPALLAAVALGVSFLGFRAARRSRRAARTAAETARRVAEADRMRAVLLAAVGHDLRSPIAAAKAAVDGLRSADIPLSAADRSELLAAADESLDRLALLTASLLDMSRLQAGKLPVFPRPAVLKDIIARAVDDVRPRPVTVCVAAGLPEVIVDPPLVERVIVNLIGNALRYSPPGTPPLLTAQAHGTRVELRVIDHGPGIPRTERARAFLPFQRLTDAGAAPAAMPGMPPGIGLGLSLARGLTEAMRGTLEAQETPGGGLTMVISLPAGTR